jgi:hypothetical protein
MPVPPAPEPQKAANRLAPAESILLRERIERIKSAVPIAGMVERYIKLQPSGDRLVGLCPFHQEHKPCSPCSRTPALSIASAARSMAM